jgi:hypothetical protein
VIVCESDGDGVGTWNLAVGHMVHAGVGQAYIRVVILLQWCNNSVPTVYQQCNNSVIAV